MRNPRSTDALRQSLHLTLDGAPQQYQHQHQHQHQHQQQPYYQYDPDASFVEISPPSSPMSSTRASIATSTMSWNPVADEAASVYSVAWAPASVPLTNAGPPQTEEPRLLSVRCLYDFTSEDPDHLSFRAEEILDVVRQEDTGWWAAVRRDGDRVGWIPSAFVQPVQVAEVPPPAAPAAPSIRDDQSVWAPEDAHENGSMPRFTAGGRSVVTSEWSHSDDESDPIMDSISPGVVDRRRESFLPPYEPEPPTYIASPTYTMPTPDLRPTNEQYPPTPETHIPVPVPPPLEMSPRYSHRPLTLTPSSASGSTSGSVWGSAGTRESIAPSFMSSIREHPLPLLPGAGTLSSSVISIAGTNTEDGGSVHLSVESASTSSDIRVNTNNLAPARAYPPSAGGRDDDSMSSGSSMRLLSPQQSRLRHTFVSHVGSEDSVERLVQVRSQQLALPWYLRTAFSEEELKVETDGVVRMGTLEAMVDWLMTELSNPQSAQTNRSVFLATFRTFAKPEDVFRLLVDQYEMNHPPNLTDEEFDDWKVRKLRPTQRRVLQTMDEWLEHHHMLHEEPQVARQLQQFLNLVKTPPEMVQLAYDTLRTLERLTFAPRTPPLPVVAPAKKKRFKSHKNELIKTDPMVLAQHITMLEWRLYARIKEQQCLNWAHTQKGPSVETLTAFCATHDKLGAWVKNTVLGNEGLGKRADMVDYWIKVAEKCRQLNNFSSTTAIVAGLASTVIAKLALTWAHVSRASHLEPLVRLNEPAGHFASYRTTLAAVEGSCIPFIGGFLTDIVQVNEQLQDPPTQPGHNRIIHFGKRRRWADAVRAIVRHQAHPYTIMEDAHMVAFLERQIAEAVSRDPTYFWSRSQELQGAEHAHADIRKGLEAAGF